MLAALLGGCGGGGEGGGGESWLYPLWVPTDIAVTDIDGDGRADILTLAQYATSATQHEGRLALHRQQAGGTFAAGETLVVGRYPWRFAIADVDGDGAPDVVVADVDANAVYLVRQDGSNRRHFLAPIQLASGMHAYDVVVGDLNGDGVPDLAVADAQRSAQRLVLLPQDPGARGSFLVPLDVALPGGSNALAAADLDGDGWVDLAAGYVVSASATDFDDHVAQLLRQPGGGLGPAQSLASAHALNLERLRIADHDGDGYPDIVAYLTASDASVVAELVAVRRLPGGGTQTFVTPLTGVDGTDDAAFGDFDGDGRLDAAVAGFYPEGSPSTVKSRLNLLLQAAGGTDSLASTHSLPAPVSRLAAGDVNGDGRLDLVMLADESQVLLALQSGSQPGSFLPVQVLP